MGLQSWQPGHSDPAALSAPVIVPCQSTFLLLEGSSSTYVGAPRVSILGGSGFPVFMVHLREAESP